MSDKSASESFVSPYLERPLRSIEEVLRGLPRERRADLMGIIEGSGDAAPSEPAEKKQPDTALRRRRA